MAGMGFGDEEAFFLQTSLNRLAIKENLKSLKFWGKIFCSDLEYFIAEATLRHNVVDAVKDNWESAGTGINALSFWVTNDLMQEWVE